MLKTTGATDKIINTPELIREMGSLKSTLDICCQLALRRPVPNLQLELMNNASLQAVEYALLIEYDPKQKYTSEWKTNAAVKYGSKHLFCPRSKCQKTLNIFQLLRSTKKIFDKLSGARPKSPSS